MDKEQQDAGTIAALMIRFREYRLPRAQRMLARVNAGETLNDSDLDFLKRVRDDSTRVRDLVVRHPEYLDLVSRFIDLYSEIIAKALENETNSAA